MAEFGIYGQLSMALTTRAQVVYLPYLGAEGSVYMYAVQIEDALETALIAARAAARFVTGRGNVADIQERAQMYPP